jgi:hypothetical protein
VPKSTIESRTLRRAAEILGGRMKLAMRLQVPLLDLDRWLAAEEKVPDIYFLRAVDIVTGQSAIEPSDPVGMLPPQSGKKPGDTPPR